VTDDPQPIEPGALLEDLARRIVGSVLERISISPGQFEFAFGIGDEIASLRIFGKVQFLVANTSGECEPWMPDEAPAAPKLGFSLLLGRRCDEAKMVGRDWMFRFGEDVIWTQDDPSAVEQFEIMCHPINGGMTLFLAG